MAIIVAASFGCFARNLARIATTQVPTTFTMAKPRKKTPKMMRKQMTVMIGIMVPIHRYQVMLPVASLNLVRCS